MGSFVSQLALSLHFPRLDLQAGYQSFLPRNVGSADPNSSPRSAYRTLASESLMSPGRQEGLQFRALS